MLCCSVDLHKGHLKSGEEFQSQMANRLMSKYSGPSNSDLCRMSFFINEAECK
jgi:hypothetical protein